MLSDRLIAELMFADRGTAILLLDPALRVVRANQTACLAFGATCRAGCPAVELFALADRPKVRAMLARVCDGAAGDTVSVGGRLVIAAEAARAGGRLEGLLLRAFDLAFLRSLDPEQTQAGKLQALGLLAGGIAHDFNNLLTAVLGAAEAALGRAKTVDPMTLEDLRIIQDGAARGQALVQQLLAFGRQQTLQPRVFAANQAVTDLSHLLRRLLGAGVRLNLALEEPGRDVCIDPGQLDQVLINLAVNARHAMPDGGTITLRTGHETLVRPLPAGSATGSDPVPPGRYVTISVADTGCGIPADLLPHLFDPFFTTRRGKGGTGLGLATVHGIIRQSNGYVGVESTQGVGTCFTLYLPRHVADARSATVVLVPPVKPPQAVDPGHVLLVEDEEPVRRLAARTLRQRGLEVVDCASAEAALDVLDGEARWDRLRVVVSDVMLPGLDGPALLRAVRGHRPGLPAILVSGYADAAQRADLAREGIQFLAKPYSQKMLAESVEGILV